LKSASFDATNDAVLDAGSKVKMRTTVTIDDEVMAKAKRYLGKTETSQILNQALLELVQREAGRRLAKMGGTDPDAIAAPRKRPWNDAKK
jgi:Arc/MetJ family transcription regulator